MNKYLYNKTLSYLFFVLALFMLLPLEGKTHTMLLNQKHVTIKTEKASIKTILDEINKQTGLNFVYKQEDLSKYPEQKINFNNTPVADVLNSILSSTKLTYKIIGNTISISRQDTTEPKTQPKTQILIKGKVLSEKGTPVVGATLTIIGTTKGAITDDKGEFSFTAMSGDKIEVSFIGMQSITETLTASNNNLIIRMKDDVMDSGDVVVTGIFTRKAESFTGSYSNFTAKDLKSVGGSNLIQSLKSLDPSFAVIEDNNWGSDPNRLPNIEINGKSSMLGMREELKTDPNQPLFILDGFESDLNTIYNLDQNRILSISILKDAASTAIYGTKAANGVVVVETVKPKSGKLFVSYNGNVNISIPDLSSYNLMNAKEKLQFDDLVGRYNQELGVDENLILYESRNAISRNIERGVDTYWLAKPLRTGVNHRHSVYIEGGDKNFSFLVGGTYNGITGVMKDSDRDNLSGNIDLIYRTNKLRFTNKFNISHTTKEEPNVSFSEYAKANPYFSEKNEKGEVTPFFINNDLISETNPVYNDNLNSRTNGREFFISNYFIAEYDPINDIKLRLRFGMTKRIDETDKFVSPNHTQYAENEPLDKGDYYYTSESGFKYEGQLTATYAKVLNDKHQLNFVVGGDINQNDNLSQGYSAHGFPDGDFTLPSFSKGYDEYGAPTYFSNKSRSVSLFANGGYSYDNRYMIDVSYRMSGSSLFGTSKRFSNTWSVGLGWNIHNESFIKDHVDGIKMLKLRGSIGNPSNLGFDSYMTYTTFAYDYNTFNYFGMSAFMSQLGNANLSWQTTLNKNLGLDITILNNRFTINADYYHKKTDPLLISINTPMSTGVTMSTTNMGNQISQGFTATLIGYMIYKPAQQITWNLRANMRTEKTKIGGIGNKLESLNKFGKTNNNLLRYYDGADPNDLWSVRSMGIDPATGREIFLKKNGELSYDYSYEDEVVVGNSRPKLEGIIGSSVKYKNFSIDINFRYRFGAHLFNYAVYNKVENISSTALKYNIDKRAVTDRWQKPGDIAKYKNIKSGINTPISSRFIQKENTFSLESLRIGYELPQKVVSKMGMSSLKIDAYMNEIFRASTIQSERGIDYPFARSFQLALSINF